MRRRLSALVSTNQRRDAIKPQTLSDPVRRNKVGRRELGETAQVTHAVL